jgi:hypothetical protein
MVTRILLNTYCQKVLMSVPKIILDGRLYIWVNKYLILLFVRKIIFLTTASLLGHKDVVECLISKGAGINLKDNHGLTPLEIGVKIIYNFYTRIISLVSFKASVKGLKGIVEYLLPNDGFVYIKDNKKIIPKKFG